MCQHAIGPGLADVAGGSAASAALATSVAPLSSSPLTIMDGGCWAGAEVPLSPQREVG